MRGPALRANPQHAAEMYKRGMSSMTIGEVIGVTPNTVRRYLRYQGIPRRPPGGLRLLDDEQEQAIAEEYGYKASISLSRKKEQEHEREKWERIETMYRKSFTILDIQDFTGVSRTNIYTRLRRSGLIKKQRWRSQLNWPDKLKIAAELGYANPFAR